MTVVKLEIAAGGVLKLMDAAVQPASELFLGQGREATLDQVEPGSGSRRKVREKWG
jgi:hypothetical protein